MFAGIVHEVSGFYLISRTDTRNDLFADGSLLTPDAERRVGGAVLAALAVPGEVVTAIEAVWQDGPLRFPPENLGDLLRLANQLTPIRSPLQPPAVDGMDLAIDPEGVRQLPEILEKSSDELEALTAACADSNALVRQSALTALAKIRDERSLAAFQKALEGHVLATATITGMYGR